VNRDDSDHLILTAIALSLVGALGAALFWGDPIAAGVLIVLAGGAWWLRRFAAAGRRHDAEFEEWRTSPETLAQFLRESGYDGHAYDRYLALSAQLRRALGEAREAAGRWEGVQSSGPSLPIMLVGPNGSVADPKYGEWSPDDLVDFHIDFDENRDEEFPGEPQR
jgi:hypothetical protein